MSIQRTWIRWLGRFGVTISSKSATICASHTKHETLGERKMPATKSEAEAKQPAALAHHYRAIGPAAIVAALLAAKKRKPLLTAPKPA